MVDIERPQFWQSCNGHGCTAGGADEMARLHDVTGGDGNGAPDLKKNVYLDVPAGGRLVAGVAGCAWCGINGNFQSVNGLTLDIFGDFLHNLWSDCTK